MAAIIRRWSFSLNSNFQRAFKGFRKVCISYTSSLNCDICNTGINMKGTYVVRRCASSIINIKNCCLNLTKNEALAVEAHKLHFNKLVKGWVTFFSDLYTICACWPSFRGPKLNYQNLRLTLWSSVNVIANHQKKSAIECAPPKRVS